MQTITDKKGYLSREDVEKIIGCTTSLRDRLILQILYRCGRRVSEALLIEYDKVLWKDKAIIFRILKRRQNEEHIIPVDGDTLQLIRKYVDEEGIRKGRLFMLSRQQVFNIIRDAGKCAGITYVGKKRLHPHHLRHSFAVHFIKKFGQARLRDLQEILCHKNISTTAEYLQFDLKDVREGYDEMWEE